MGFKVEAFFYADLLEQTAASCCGDRKQRQQQQILTHLTTCCCCCRNHPLDRVWMLRRRLSLRSSVVRLPNEKQLGFLLPLWTKGSSRFRPHHLLVLSSCGANDSNARDGFYAEHEKYLTVVVLQLSPPHTRRRKEEGSHIAKLFDASKKKRASMSDMPERK